MRSKKQRRNSGRRSPIKVMDQTAMGWMVNQARLNLWKLQPLFDLGDLIQEGHAIWLKVADRYGKTAKNRSHLMSLFQVSYRNHIINLAKSRTRHHDGALAYEQFRATAPALDSDAALVLAEVNKPIRRKHDRLSFWDDAIPPQVAIIAVLKLYASPEGRRKLRGVHLRRRNGSRETTNDMLARLTGLPKGTDFEAAFYDHFS